MEGAHCKGSSESEDNRPMVDADVVIVGAGISGLSAAYYIQKKDSGIRLAVLEAKGEQLTDKLMKSELWNFRTKELSFRGTKVPWYESSCYHEKHSALNTIATIRCVKSVEK